MTPEEKLDARYALAYRAEYSARYHRRRASFLETVDTLFNLLVLIAGTGAFVALIGTAPKVVPQGAALAVAIVTILQIVFGVGPSGARHAEWMRRWDRLANEIRGNKNPSETVLRRWEDERASLEGECVSEFRALVVACENDTRAFMGVSEGIRSIAPLQRMIMHLGTYQAKFPIVETKPTKVPYVAEEPPANGTCDFGG